jgi:hypothetical protein
MGLAALLRLLHLVPAHLRHLERLPSACVLPSRSNLRTLPGISPRPGTSPVAVVEQHLHAHADAEQRLVDAFEHGLLQADSRSSRMQSGMAP